MKTDLPKQFLPLGDKLVLMHTLERFFTFDPTTQLILTLPPDWKNYWKECCDNHDFKINHHLVDGGEQRYDSIKNALDVAEGDYIAIHDGVRPLVSNQTLKKVMKEAEKSGAAIPVLPVNDSLRKLQMDKNTAVDRSLFYTVQTPQCFSKKIIFEAYDQPIDIKTTDDASLVEKLGVPISLVEGNQENIKITTPLDLKIANFLIEKDK